MKCGFCGKGDKDFRQPSNYKLYKIVDPLDRTLWIYAHKGCIIDYSFSYNKLYEEMNQLRQSFRALLR